MTIQSPLLANRAGISGRSSQGDDIRLRHLDRPPPLVSRGADGSYLSDRPVLALSAWLTRRHPSYETCSTTHGMSAQRLAIEVIEYPANKRDQVMQCMGSLLTEVAREAGCTHEMAHEFGAAMEQTIRGYVSEIEASGGGTVGTA